MAAAALSLEFFNDEKLRALRSYVTPEILNLINHSEILKSDSQNYAGNSAVDNITVSTIKPDSASYRLPIANGQKGVAIFGANRLTSASDFISIVSHELGHFVAENAGAAVQVARADALARSDLAAYEAACNLTEGYAHPMTARVYEEILNSELGKGSSFMLTQLRTRDDYQKNV